MRVPEDFLETCDIYWKDKDKAREELVDQYFHNISNDLKRVILESTDELTPRPLFELPVESTWPHRAGVTLMGDAAHLMTPFAGVGVNVGMTDGFVLRRSIIAASKIAALKRKKMLDEAVEEYEREMFPRAEDRLKEDESKELADMMWAHKGPECLGMRLSAVAKVNFVRML